MGGLNIFVPGQTTPDVRQLVRETFGNALPSDDKAIGEILWGFTAYPWGDWPTWERQLQRYIELGPECVMEEDHRLYVAAQERIEGKRQRLECPDTVLPLLTDAYPDTMSGFMTGLRVALRRHTETQEITAATADKAIRLFDMILAAMPAPIRFPQVDLMSGGRLLFTWNTGPEHLDIEIIPDQPTEFFYRDRQTDDAGDVDLEDWSPLPSILCRWLRMHLVPDS